MKSKERGILFLVSILILFSYAMGWTGEGDLAWSTFLGGSSDDGGNDIAVDTAGNVYVVGSTRSPEFPATDEAFDTSYNDKTDAFVIRIGSGGEVLGYATYLGGSGGDRGFGIAVDNSGHAYVTGFTYSDDFPTTPGAFDTTHNSSGGLYNDVFVAKLSPTGDHLLFATFLGGGRDEGGYGIAVDDVGCAHIAGDTQSMNFPVTAAAFDTVYHGNSDLFWAKLNPSGTVLEFSTYLGGGAIEYCDDMAIDNSGNAYLTGETQSSDFPTTPGAFDESYNGSHDAFLTKVGSSGSELVYSSFLGGSAWDRGVDIAVDISGHAYLTGYTTSSGFPHTISAYDATYNGGRDAFVAKLNPAGSTLIYGTFLGGDSDDRGLGIGVDDSGAVSLTGRTASSTFPTSAEAFDPSYNGDDDVFFVKINVEGSALLYSTFLGGEGYEYGNGIALRRSDEVWVAGVTTSSDFPVTPESFDATYNGWEDIFVTKLELRATSVKPPPAIGVPKNFALRQNYPNPFNPATEIEYCVPRDVRATLKVYDIRGAEVAILVDAPRSAGSYAVTWNAAEQASGIYFCLLEAEDFKAIKKMILLK